MERAKRAWLALLFAGLGAAPHQCGAPSAPRGCDHWIRVNDLGVCGVGGLAGVFAVCPPDGPIRVGDWVRLAPALPGCRARVSRMPAADRLAMGLRVEVNAEGAVALQAVSGVGPATARALLRARPYLRPEDMERARGVGPRKRARLTAAVRLTPPPRLWPSSPPRAASSPQRP